MMDAPVQEPQAPELSLPKPKKPYKELNLEEKVTLIKMAQDNPRMSQAELAKIFGIAKSNVCRILKRRYEYLSVYECASFSGERKRKLRDSDTKELNVLVAWWVRNRFQKGESVSGPLIQEKAREFAQLLNVTNFVASNGWLQGFQKSYFNTMNLSSSSEKPSTSVDAPTKTPPANETLRAHMFKQHQISRMFMCRCCNWAFPDKTSLQIHMQSMATGNPTDVSILAKGGAAGSALIGELNNTPRSSIDEDMEQMSEPSTPLDPKDLLHTLLFNASQQQQHQPKEPQTTVESDTTEVESWLNNFPKVDASGVGSLGGTLCLTEEEDEEVSDGNNNSYRFTKTDSAITDEMEGVEPSESHGGIYEDKIPSGDFQEPPGKLFGSAKRKSFGSSSIFQGNTTLPIPAFLQKSFQSRDTEEHQTRTESPSNTHSSESLSRNQPDSPTLVDSGSDEPQNPNGKVSCFTCQILKGRLALSENRNRFLDGKVRTCENKVSRLQDKISSMDSNQRRYEVEGSSLREQNNSLQAKLLQCQEKALAYLQKGLADPDNTQKFLTEILQATYIG